MARVHDFFPTTLYGSIDVDLQVADTTLSSPQLAALPAVASPDTLALVLSYGVQAKEIVWVTAHTADAATATISRGQESTSAAYWPANTGWTHAATDADYELAGVAAFVDPATATAGQIATALINAGLMAAS